MLFSTRDNVRTQSAIEEDRLKAEVAAGREGKECCFEPHTLTRMTGHCSMLAVQHHVSTQKHGYCLENCDYG